MRATKWIQAATKSAFGFFLGAFDELALVVRSSFAMETIRETVASKRFGYTFRVWFFGTKIISNCILYPTSGKVTHLVRRYHNAFEQRKTQRPQRQSANVDNRPDGPALPADWRMEVRHGQRDINATTSICIAEAIVDGNEKTHDRGGGREDLLQSHY